MARVLTGAAPSAMPIAGRTQRTALAAHLLSLYLSPMPTLADLPQPPRDCPLCPRLVAFREEQQDKHPDWYNAPVKGWGDPNAWLCLVGLAPGLRGANATGRPFTGDFAGDLLFATLDAFGLSQGRYDARPDDGYQLKGAFISNAVRCVPPQNKPTPAEIKTCRPFLIGQLETLTNVRVMIALGQIAHQSTLKTYGLTQSHFKFGHGARHELPDGRILIDSYHCSRYNTNTGRLTPEMFADVFRAAEAERSGAEFRPLQGSRTTRPTT